MSKRPTEITENNFLLVDVSSIAKDLRFDDLPFVKARKQLPQIQQWLLEAEKLNKDNLLIRGDLDQIENFKNRLKEFLRNLLTFSNRTTSDNALQEHTDLENRINSFYTDVYQTLAMRVLPFLRNEIARNSRDEQELERQQKAVSEIQAEYSTLRDEMKKELDEVRERRAVVEKEQGELVAVGLGTDFYDQAKFYEEEAKKWLGRRTTWFKVLVWIISLNGAGYFLLFITFKINLWPYLDPKDFFTLQYGLIKLALLAILSYAIGFNSRNYNINMGLAATNRHRKNVSDTLLNSLSSGMTPEDKSKLMSEAASAMFKHLPVGYINKEHQNDSGPVIEMVKRFSSKD
jgi:hypothetical protein